MKVSRNAWKPGAQWEAKTEKGYLKAIIISNDRPGHKIVRMTYQDGRWQNRPVEASYSHRHMLKYFVFTGVIGDVPPPLPTEKPLDIKDIL